jgi:predicted RNA-binding protein
MAYWLYITNSDNWKVTEEKNLLGGARRHKNSLGRMSTGDRVLIYVMSRRHAGEMTVPTIGGEYEVASSLFEEDTKIFKAPPNVP